MLAILLAAAAQGGPSLPPLGRAITIADYPRSAVVSGRSAAALVELAIEPAGRISDCHAIQRFGDAALADTICPLIQRKRLRGAAFRDGTPAYTFLTTLIRFVVSGGQQSEEIAALKQQPDARLAVSHLPDHAASADVDLVLAVDTRGAVTDCAGNRDIANPPATTLVSAVCAGGAQWQLPIRTDAVGTPVAYVTTMKVGLTTASPAP